MITSKEYIDRHGLVCPFCLTEDSLSGEEVNIEAGAAFQEVSCHKCDSRWVDNYSLTSFTVIQEPQPEKPEHHVLIVLSTAHLTKSGLAALEGLRADDSRSAGPGMYADPFTYGWWITLAPIDESNKDDEYIADELRLIRQYADNEGATAIRLDADGPIVPGLPHYNHN
jgi:hypothetical protein